jgi:gamma-glutamylcyclotransferase (GGCT)/AIG2-like uncharacterized protein YtfP
MADRSPDASASQSPVSLIFAYGTLMTGYGNNRLLDGAQSLGRAHTRDNSFKMCHAGVPFVCRVEEAGVSVAGEVFAVSDAAMLVRIDNLEGHPDWCATRRVIYRRHYRPIPDLSENNSLQQVQAHSHRRHPGRHGPSFTRRNLLEHLQRRHSYCAQWRLSRRRASRSPSLITSHLRVLP